VHLGHLARDLRTLGFDTLYERDLTDDEIVARAVDEHRIVLTRDRGILERRAVTHGHWIRTTDPEAQIVEVVRALDLKDSIEFFTRCRECNGELEAVARVTVHDEVPPKIFAEHDVFTRCSGCGRVYWRGSHYDRMRERLGDLLD
jgi:hypothetical protein